MKAYIVDRYGSGGGSLRAGEMPEPEVKEEDVLVQVHAAGVNALDSKIRDGEFKLILPYRPPFILGNDVAGVVVRIGTRVRKFQPGDEVYARPGKDRIGTFAEFISVSEDDLALKPKQLTMEEAGAIPLAALTAWQALIEIADLRKGQKILIHAGSGGVGTFAIQLAKYLGARRHDHQRGQHRLGQTPRRRCRDQLSGGRLRNRPARLRRGFERPGQ